ncbi:hypothetical protein [Roseateles sp. LYH14W]|uniref:HEAT repeat domain-containing protein n=1 Tax=Pelomonas parva TaxID=3299032 RepID=A0ABW7F5F8_9BURK
MTPTIVLAKAVAAHAGNGTPNDPPMVSFTVQDVVKGTPPSSTFKLEGVTDVYDGPSSESSFDEVRPGAQRGACNAYDYRLGTTYLLFLGLGVKPTDILGSPPYTRINEEARQDSPWLAAVRHYARVATLKNPVAERRELQALELKAKTAPRDPRYPKQMVSDIKQHFASPSRLKTFAELLALYEGQGVHKDIKSGALLAMATAPKPEARYLFDRAIRSGDWHAHPHVTGKFVENTRDGELASLMLAELPGTSDEQLHETIVRTAIIAAPRHEAPRMLQALRAAPPEETRQLARWFARFPSPEATQILKSRLKVDYAQDWELAFIVAGLGDSDVLAWGQRLTALRSNDAWMGYYVVARSPLPAADALARRAIRRADEESLMALVQGYKDSTNPNLWDRLADVAAMRQRPPKVDAWLKTVLKQRAEARDARSAALLQSLGSPAATPANLSQ